MPLLFVITMICVLLLALTGSMPLWATASIIAACLFGLLLIGAVEQQRLHQLKRRCVQLGAVWGLPTRHLGGLPLPLDTAGNLFFVQNFLLLDTEHDQHQIMVDDLLHIFLVTADQIKKLSDRHLCDLLETGSVRSFSSLREKIRRHDSVLHNQGLLMIAYRTDDETRLLILAARHTLSYTASLLCQSVIGDRTHFILADGSLGKPCHNPDKY